MDTLAACRILYFCPDIAHPSGGVRAIYEHVAHLNRSGLPAYVVHCKQGFRPQWFAATLPTLYSESGVQLGGADVLVFPEHSSIAPELQTFPCRKILFCQNHFYLFMALPPGQTLSSLGITHVLASSEVIAQFVQKNLGWPDVPVVHCSIDHQLFKPGKKKLQIAYMPRKDPTIAGFIRGLFAAPGSQATQVPWIEINNLPIDRVAAILAESAIFLSLSRLEGFGLPPVEAMASGCAVVGYHGYGGLEYARPDNGFWCEEGNPVSCAATLQNVVEMFLGGDARINQVIEAGMKTAAKYTPQRQEQELVRFMKRILSEK